jgi:para-nitrobenzyl esterase
MRLISFAVSTALAMSGGLALAQTAPAKQPASPGAAMAPAAKSKAKVYSSTTSTMETLLKDPAAKAVLEKYVPELIKSDHLEQMSAMTLKDVQQAVGQYAPDLLSDKKLVLIDEDLAKLPVKK